MSHLTLTTGQYPFDRGRKEINQDFHGLYIPREPQLSARGRGHRAGGRHQQQRRGTYRQRVGGQAFLDDYYCTSDAWPVRTSAGAGTGRHQLLADFRNPAQPFPRTGIAAMFAPSAPSWSGRRPRTWCTSATRASTGFRNGALEQLEQRSSADRPEPKARRPRPERKGPLEIDYGRCRSRSARCLFWRRTASTSSLIGVSSSTDASCHADPAR